MIQSAITDCLGSLASVPVKEGLILALVTISVSVVDLAIPGLEFTGRVIRIQPIFISTLITRSHAPIGSCDMFNAIRGFLDT